MVKNISKFFYEYINCSVKRMTQPNSGSPEIEIKSLVVKVQGKYF